MVTVAPDDAGGSAISGAGDLGGHVDIAPGPVGGGNVPEDGAIELGGNFISVAHELHSHFAELRPGQHPVGGEDISAGAVHHSHKPEEFGGLGHMGILDIHKGSQFDICRQSGGGKGSAQQAQSQAGGQNTFVSHCFSLLRFG